jgi:hypothetical protein
MRQQQIQQQQQQQQQQQSVMQKPNTNQNANEQPQGDEEEGEQSNYSSQHNRPQWKISPESQLERIRVYTVERPSSEMMGEEQNFILNWLQKEDKLEKQEWLPARISHLSNQGGDHMVRIISYSPSCSLSLCLFVCLCVCVFVSFFRAIFLYLDILFLVFTSHSCS